MPKEIVPGQHWRKKDRNGNPYNVVILSAFVDLYGIKRVVFQHYKEPRFIEVEGRRKVTLYESRIPPKLVTTCYITCSFDCIKEAA